MRLFYTLLNSFGFVCGGLLMATAAIADTPSLQGVGTHPVIINTSDVNPDGTPVTKIISFKRVIPSKEFLKRKMEYFHDNSGAAKELDYSGGIIPFSQSPGAVDLGMNNVPVLDQGTYGTCVTFASTAAMDALLGQGDFISQQCSLELNLGLGYNYWNGADVASQIIDPLKQYGLVRQGTCDNPYPASEQSLSPSQYSNYVDTTVTASNINYKYTRGITLDQVKRALKSGHRIAVGFGLVINSYDPISSQGFNVRINGTQTVGGLWACQQRSVSSANYCGEPTDGHEVIVIGYDDKQQLLKIRNSWNTAVGDNGDFYMTYAYFTKMNDDGTEVFLSNQNY